LQKVIQQDAEIYRRKLSSPSDVSADAGLKSAYTLLQRAASSEEEAVRSTYVLEAEQYLHLVMNMGYGPVIISPPTKESKERLTRMAPSLSLLPILAEGYLSGTSWALRDRAASTRYLLSALEKAKAMALVQKVKFVSVDEEVLVYVNESRAVQIGWSYKGRRPEIGSAAHLCQDLEFTLRVAQTSEIPQPLEIYDKWETVINALRT
jgi:hypothetical protein